MKLKSDELLILFFHSVDNANYLFKSARDIVFNSKGKKYPSLGLAELALEELGKSYTCLAYYSTANCIEDWSLFWKDWKGHETKASRAFFYEFFCLLRLEIDAPEFKSNFPSTKGKFSKEKELAFYVDIDRGNRKLLIPSVEVTDIECMNRIASLVGLFNAAFHVVDWMKAEKPAQYRKAISDYAYKTLTTEMYQHDVEQVIQQMHHPVDQDYNSGLQDILTLFKSSIG